LDPIPPDESFGILRGGDYFSQPPQMRTTYRARTNKLERRPGIGFRCAADGR
jgi:formylglycine-generating enzyme required for sulfatase activity